MIVELHVENIAVIEKSQIQLGPGFTVLTGETGAGKSLLVDAIGLALGDRADSDLVRDGAARGFVSLVIDLSDAAPARSVCEEHGVAVEEGQLFIQREISCEGRSTARIGGKLVPVSVLKKIGEHLVDLHGQHDHQALLNPEEHLEYLDLWIGAEALQLRKDVAEAFRNFQLAQAQLGQLRRSVRDRQQRLDMLIFQVGELESANLQPGKLESLLVQLSRLQHAEKIRNATEQGLGILEEGEVPALDQIGSVLDLLEQILRLDSSAESMVSNYRSVYYALQDSVRELRHYREGIEVDDESLNSTLVEVDLVQRVLRKYGDTEEAALTYLEECRKELALLEDADSNEEHLSAKVEEYREQFNSLAQNLSDLRKQKQPEFSSLVRSELHQLAMEKAEFGVKILPREGDERGIDDIHFEFSANAGEPMRALHRIASGGEMSRVMLSLKVVLAGKAGVPSLIFDEIDTGLSGRAAAVVANKLEQISSYYQVISISHLPQLAGKANTHFKIEKVVTGGRTHTQVRQLQKNERIHEVARMLAGEEIGEAAIANAKDLLGV